MYLFVLSCILLGCFGDIIKRECSEEAKTSLQCSNTLDPVCAYFTGETCDSEICAKQMMNHCFACKDTSVKYYVNGPCDPGKIFCDNNTRDYLPVFCDKRGPVCGYFTENCPFDICGKVIESNCEACRDPTIIYYKPGTCDNFVKVESCELSQCYFLDKQSFGPICYFPSNCTSENCAQTLPNECEVCLTYKSGLYKRGICDKDRIDCQISTNDPSIKNCENFETNPVCAYFTIFQLDLGKRLYGTTVSNSCLACKDAAVSYYSPGECRSNDDGRTFCLPNHNFMDCLDTSEPVCGFKVEDQLVTKKEYLNSCTACQDQAVTFYESGLCKYQCESYPENMEDGLIRCDGSFVDPVCAYISLGDLDNNQITKMSVKNKCVACYDLSLSVNFYTKGLCQGDQGIKCENEPLSYYYGRIFPICGVLKENCEDDSCRVTFSEPVVACNYFSAIFYTSGYCPGDQGISCMPYNSLSSNLCHTKDFSLTVCGYSRKDCKDNSCRTTFINQCYACESSSIFFFTEGACPDEIR